MSMDQNLNKQVNQPARGRGEGTENYFNHSDQGKPANYDNARRPIEEKKLAVNPAEAIRKLSEMQILNRRMQGAMARGDSAQIAELSASLTNLASEMKEMAKHQSSAQTEIKAQLATAYTNLQKAKDFLPKESEAESVEVVENQADIVEELGMEVEKKVSYTEEELISEEFKFSQEVKDLASFMAKFEAYKSEFVNDILPTYLGNVYKYAQQFELDRYTSSSFVETKKTLDSLYSQMFSLMSKIEALPQNIEESKSALLNVLKSIQANQNVLNVVLGGQQNYVNMLESFVKMADAIAGLDSLMGAQASFTKPEDNN